MDTIQQLQCGSEPTINQNTLQSRSEINSALAITDTITLRFPVKLKPEQYRGKLKHYSKEQKNGFDFHGYTEVIYTAKKVGITVTYFPRFWDKRSYLQFTFSGQKLVLGNNYGVIKPGVDILKIIEEELNPIYKILSMKPLTLLDGLICRIDACHNFYITVTNYLQQYIRIASHQIIPRYKRRMYMNPKTIKNDNAEEEVDEGDNGVKHCTDDHEVRLYDKLKECGEKGSENLLRLESSIKTNAKVGDLLNVKKPTLRNLKKQPLIDDLKARMSQLNLDKKSVQKRTIADILIEHSLKRMVPGLLLYCTQKANYPELSKEELAKKMDRSVTNVNKCIKLLAKLGIGDVCEDELDIPALTLEDTVATKKNDRSVSKKDSNTCGAGLEKLADGTLGEERSDEPSVLIEMLPMEEEFEFIGTDTPENQEKYAPISIQLWELLFAKAIPLIAPIDFTQQAVRTNSNNRFLGAILSKIPYC